MNVTMRPIFFVQLIIIKILISQNINMWIIWDD